MLAILLLVGLSLSPAPDGADEQYSFIAGLAEKGMHERVVKESEAFLAQYPRHAKADAARYRMACALFELHDARKAAGEFKKLSSRRGFEFEAEVAFRLGQCQLDVGDCAGAEVAFARAVEAHKDYLMAPAQWLLGEARLRCGHPETAEESYAAVLALDPQGKYAADAMAGLAWCAFKAKKFDAAADRARSYLDRFAKSARGDEIDFLLGESLFELKQMKPALQAYGAVGIGAWADGALRGTGFAYAALGDHERAARSFARVVSEFPDSVHAPECALHGGIEWLGANQPSEAVRLLRSKAAGESIDALTWLSRAESANGEKEAALETIDRALQLAQDADTKARLRGARADALNALGKKDEALREYERAGSDYALQAAAVAALQAGKTAEARRAAEKLLAQFPESTYRNDAAIVLGEVQLAEKHFAAAMKSFEAALASERDPAKRVRCRSRVAWCKYLVDDKAGAAAAFASLAREAPDAPEAEEAAFMTGRALEASNDAQGAVRAYDDYAARYANGPHRDEALFRLSKLDTSESGTDRLARFVRDHPIREPASARDLSSTGEPASAQDLASTGDLASAGELASPDHSARTEKLAPTGNPAPTRDLAMRARYELAERLSAAGKPRDAAKLYREVLETSPDAELAPAARYGLAWCLQQSGESAAAAKLLRPWIDDNNGDRELRASALELLVWCEAKLAPPTGVAAAWNALLASSDDEARLLRAVRAAIDPLRKADRADEALELLGAFGKRARDPDVIAALGVERVYLSLDRKRLDDAERDLARAVSARKDDAGVAEAAFFVGEARFEQGDARRALELYDQAARNVKNPARDRALYKAGFARLKGNDAAGAERCFTELIEHCAKSPLFYETLFLVGEAQYRQREFEAACASLERVVKESPQHEVVPKALFRLGLARCEREDWKGALEALTALATKKPDFENAAEAELARGRALVHLNRARDARGAFERTIALDKGALSARAHIELGRMHFAAKAYDPALSEFLKVAVLYDLPEETAQALLGAGGTLEAQGDAAHAIDQYRELVEKYGQSSVAPAAKTRLRELQSKDKRGQ